eukprot:scaffold15_cov234-Pinguiococcus_pyrenoidosus.AAC.9
MPLRLEIGDPVAPRSTATWTAAQRRPDFDPDAARFSDGNVFPEREPETLPTLERQGRCCYEALNDETKLVDERVHLSRARCFGSNGALRHTRTPLWWTQWLEGDARTTGASRPSSSSSASWWYPSSCTSSTSGGTMWRRRGCIRSAATARRWRGRPRRAESGKRSRREMPKPSIPKTSAGTPKDRHSARRGDSSSDDLERHSHLSRRKPGFACACRRCGQRGMAGQVSRLKPQGSRLKAQGSSLKAQGSVGAKRKLHTIGAAAWEENDSGVKERTAKHGEKKRCKDVRWFATLLINVW